MAIRHGEHLSTNKHFDTKSSKKTPKIDVKMPKINIGSKKIAPNNNFAFFISGSDDTEDDVDTIYPCWLQNE